MFPRRARLTCGFDRSRIGSLGFLKTDGRARFDGATTTASEAAGPYLNQVRRVPPQATSFWAV